MNTKNIITSGSLDITYDCNLRCRHCFNSSGEQQYDRKMLSDEEIAKISNEIATLPNLQSFCFCGGEPMLRKNILLRSANILKKGNKRLTVNSVTNGYFLDESLVSEIKKSSLDMIQISVDGHDDKTHNYIRNNDKSYERAINSIKILIDNGIRVSVATLPTKLILNHLDEHIKHMESLGVSLLRFQPLMLLGRAKTNMNDLILSDLEYRQLARYLLRLESERSSSNQMKIEWGDPIQHLLDFNNRDLIYIDINAYGEIILSPYLPIVIGDLRKHTLDEYFENNLKNVWKSEFVKKIASKITSWNKMDLSEYYDIPSIFSKDVYKFDVAEDNKLFTTTLNI